MTILHEKLMTSQNEVTILTFEYSGETKTINALRDSVVLLLQGSIDILSEGVVTNHIAPKNFTFDKNKTIIVTSTQDDTKLAFCLSSFQALNLSN